MFFASWNTRATPIGFLWNKARQNCGERERHHIARIFFKCGSRIHHAGQMFYPAKIDSISTPG